MSIHALIVLLTVVGCSILAIIKHPFWGLVGYVFLYFNNPNPEINWWAADLPYIRWSFLVSAVIIFSVFKNGSRLGAICVWQAKNFRILVLLFVLMFIISPFSVSSESSYTKLYDFFRYLICFVLFIKSVPNMTKFELLVWVCLACCFYLSWEAYIHPEYRHAGRLEGIGTADSTDSNMFATVLMMAVPFLITEVLFASKIRKLLALGISVFVLNGIVLTGSRGAIVGLAAMGLTYLFCERDRKTRKKILIGVICAVLLFVKLLDPTFINRLVVTGEGGDSTGSGRTETWAYGLMMAKDNPFGTGGGGFEYLSSHYLPEQLLTRGGRRASHNTYLQVLVEQGFAGLILFLLFWVSTLRMLHRIRHNITSLAPVSGTDLFKVRQYALATEAAIVSILVSGFFVDRLYFELIYWLAAMATFLYYHGERLLDLQAREVL